MKTYKIQSIPRNARKVFTGKLCEIYQWEQNMFDGKTKIFEKIKYNDAVNIIAITKNKNILVTKEIQPQSKSFYSVPGGTIDNNETPLDGAKRELLEETGYEAKKWLKFHQSQPMTRLEWNVYTYIAIDCEKKKNQIQSNGSKIIVSEKSLLEFLNIIMDDTYRDREITLKLLKIRDNPKAWKKFEKLFS
ncbi:MAG TPA: NUDIX hydrolase [Candidatus Dojkabacteria bacterium]|nr:NUDIX hydrolase [Candidatus Dojkabacteria bacterium]